MQLRWAIEIVRWLRRAVLGNDRPTLTLLEDHYSDTGAAYRIDDPSIPGCCDCWRIVRYDSPATFCIIVLNLSELRFDLAQWKVGRGDRLEPWQRHLASNLEKEIQTQAKTVFGTHIWINCWLADVRRSDTRGRHYTAPVAELIGCYVCDLQGIGGELRGNRYAQHMAKIIARRMLRLQTGLNTFDDLICAIPWLEWLEFYAQRIISTDHVLQPPRGR